MIYLSFHPSFLPSFLPSILPSIHSSFHPSSHLSFQPASLLSILHHPSVFHLSLHPSIHHPIHPSFHLSHIHHASIFPIYLNPEKVMSQCPTPNPFLFMKYVKMHLHQNKVDSFLLPCIPTFPVDSSLFCYLQVNSWCMFQLPLNDSTLIHPRFVSKSSRNHPALEFVFLLCTCPLKNVWYYSYLRFYLRGNRSTKVTCWTAGQQVKWLIPHLGHDSYQHSSH